MCCFCENWKRRSPKSFARWADAAQGRGDPHTYHVIGCAIATAQDIITQVGIARLLEAFENGAEIGWEGEGENFPDLTRAP
jgi:hypothetical protein